MSKLDWRTLAPPQEYHSCDCQHCDLDGDLEPVRWPILVPMVIRDVEYITDRYMAIRSDLAPVPEDYEGGVLAQTTTDKATFNAALTDEPPVGVHFRWQIMSALDATGWRLRMLEGEPKNPGGRSHLIGVVTADGEHIGWACSAIRVNEDYYDDTFTREYVEPEDGAS